MNISQIQENLENLLSSFSEESFIYEFLLAYGIPRATINLIKNWKRNLSKVEGQIILKNKLFFISIKDGSDLHLMSYKINSDLNTHKQKPRIIIITDYKILLAIDTKTWVQKEMLLQRDLDPKQKLQTFDKHVDFFLPLVSQSKDKLVEENPADIKAAYTLAKLYDAIREDNNFSSPGEIHALNVFLSRILFCFFAEDTEIFPKDIFTYSLESHTQEDGSDLHTYLEKLFSILDKKVEERWSVAEYLQKFPYVNGGLFRERLIIPVFKKKSRSILIECWKDLNWSEINPDIFGSMVQAVVHPDQRSGLGMHYTSVPNIMKVIQPLFLDELRLEYEKNIDNPKALERLLARMEKIRIFDPACGSGNFLIIAYKELRKLEMDILDAMLSEGVLTLFSRITLDQSYGIEIDDFAHEVAGLSLYIANHQMNREFESRFGVVQPLLPLKNGGNIVCANATRIDWEIVCPKDEGYEVYIIWNPPYQWARKQNEDQRSDIKYLFWKEWNSIDYITCWFYLWVKYITWYNASLALVSTNSICQWEQVSLIWPKILWNTIEITFAYTSFKWKNNAKSNAGVTVIIVWLANIKKLKSKRIYSSWIQYECENINTYLTDGSSIIVEPRSRVIHCGNPMETWSRANDKWLLLFTENEFLEITRDDSSIKHLFKEIIGADEFIKWKKRYALWLENIDITTIKNNEILSRLEQLSRLRKNYWLFTRINKPKNDYIFIPQISSESREYIPIGILSPTKAIPLDPHFFIDNAEPWIFWIITSKMHMIWIRSVCGSLETRIRYSSSLWYNTFPFPNISPSQKEAITNNVYNILEEREKHPEKTMAELYDPDTMPDGLREAHKLLDELIERCYRATPFKSDEDRLSYLFNLYEKMIEEEERKSI